MDSELSKTERRRIAKQAKKLKLQSAKEADMTDRQKQRVESKQKKVLPKLTRDDRKRKYQEELCEAPRMAEQSKKLFCLNCKKKGHILADCPDGKAEGIKSSSGIVSTERICYNCGSYDHALRTCRKPRDPKGKLPFASCFVCKGTGHISRDCPNNENGLYPNGGGCLECDSKFHFAKDCPTKAEKRLVEEEEEEMKAKEEEMNPKIQQKREALGGDDDDFGDFHDLGEGQGDDGDIVYISETVKVKKSKKSKN